MSSAAIENIVLQKTRELCQTIIDQPEYKELRGKIDSFLKDEFAQKQYQDVMQRGDALNQKQRQGVPLADTEIAEFESKRDALLNNGVARGFLDAQESMHEMHQTVSRCLTKTFELGRVPSVEDLDEGGSCGAGCGCHH